MTLISKVRVWEVLNLRPVRLLSREENVMGGQAL